MTKSIINIGLACGGTGGHISPALALASNFENYNIKPVFITDVRGSSLLKSMSHYVVLSGSPSTKGFTKVLTSEKYTIEGEDIVFNNYKKANKHIIDMVKHGAKIIDVGGESTRPGSKAISVKTEWNRLKKILDLRYLFK